MTRRLWHRWLNFQSHDLCQIIHLCIIRRHLAIRHSAILVHRSVTRYSIHADIKLLDILCHDIHNKCVVRNVLTLRLQFRTPKRRELQLLHAQGFTRSHPSFFVVQYRFTARLSQLSLTQLFACELIFLSPGIVPRLCPRRQQRTMASAQTVWPRVLRRRLASLKPRLTAQKLVQPRLLTHKRIVHLDWFRLDERCAPFIGAFPATPFTRPRLEPLLHAARGCRLCRHLRDITRR